MKHDRPNDANTAVSTRRTLLATVVLCLGIAVVLAVAMGAGTASAANEIESCEEITEAGEYEITDDLSSDEICLEIDLSDPSQSIHIDGNDHVITGGDGDDYPLVGIHQNHEAVTVENLHVENHDGPGIHQLANTDVTLENVVSKQNEDGIRVESESSLSLMESTITGNNASGIHVWDSSTNVLVEGEGTVSNNSNGIVVEFSQDVTISGLEVRENNYSGILVGGSDQVVVEDITVEENLEAVDGEDGGGVWLKDTSNSEVTNVQAHGNDGIGVNVEDAPSTVLDDVVANDNDAGVYVIDESPGTHVEDIQANDNTEIGIGASGGGADDPVEGISIVDVEASGNGDFGFLTSNLGGPDIDGAEFHENDGVGFGSFGTIDNASVTSVSTQNNEVGVLLAAGRHNDSELMDVDASYNDVGFGISTVSVWENVETTISDSRTVGNADADIDLSEASDVHFEDHHLNDERIDLSGDNVSISSAAPTIDDPSDTANVGGSVHAAPYDPANETTDLSLTIHYEGPAIGVDSETLEPYDYAEGESAWSSVEDGDHDEDAHLMTVEYEGLTANTTVAGFADLDRDIDQCGVVYGSGEATLTEDLVAEETCIVIREDDVHLDGNGHAISAEEDNGGPMWLVEEAWGVYVTGDGVTVSDLELEGESGSSTDAAMVFHDASDGSISDIEATNSSEGIWLHRVSDVEVSDVDLADNEAYGILVENSSGVDMESVESIDAGISGIGVFGVEEQLPLDQNPVTLQSSSVQGGFFPVQVVDVSGLEVSDLQVEDGDWGGLFLENTTAASLSDVAIQGGEVFGIGLAESHGNDLDGVEVTDIGVADEESAAFWIGESDGNQITDALALDNLDQDVIVGESTGTAFDGLQLNNETVSLGGDNYTVRSAPLPAEPPEDLLGTSASLAVDNTTPEMNLEVALHYTDEDVEDIDEDTLDVWHHNGTDWALATDRLAGNAALTSGSEDATIQQSGSVALFGEEETAAPPPPPPPDDPAFQLDTLDAPDTVEEDATFTASVTLENVGDGDGSTDVVATFADQEVTEEDVELQAGESESLEFEFAADVDPDDYDLAVEETHGGETVSTTVTVEALEDDDDDDSPVVEDDADDDPPVSDDADDDADDADDDLPVEDVADDADDDAFPIPGFGPVAALIAILAVVGAVARLRPLT